MMWALAMLCTSMSWARREEIAYNCSNCNNNKYIALQVAAVSGKWLAILIVGNHVKRIKYILIIECTRVANAAATTTTPAIYIVNNMQSSVETFAMNTKLITIAPVLRILRWVFCPSSSFFWLCCFGCLIYIACEKEVMCGKGDANGNANAMI